MANELVRFTTGLKANLGNESKQAGKVLFVLNDDDSTGSIYFDKDNSHRYRMSYDLKDTTNTFTASAAAVTTTPGRVYPVALDKDGFLAVNVPWTNTTYSAGNGLYLSSLKFYNTGVLSIASGDANGTIKVTTGTNTGGTSSVDVAIKGLKDLAYIAKPSANTTTTYLRGDGTWVAPPNTTYNGSLGVTLSGTTFKASLVSETQNTAAAGSGKLYAVQLDKNGKLAVNVPWTDNDHQYTASGKGITLSGTQFALSLKDDTFKTTDAAVLPVTANTNRTYPLVLDKNSVLAVNVPWTDTTYGPATTGSAGLMSATDKQKLDGIAEGAKTGTVTSIATGIGLTGGTITTSGTIKVKLKDETLSTYEASNSTASGASQYYTVTADKKGDLAVYVPWINTTYSPGTGITIGSGNQINHNNSITAGTAKGDNNKTLTWSGTFTIPTVTYDAQGHITATGTTTMTMPANPHSETIYTGTAPISVNSSTKVISINNGAIVNAKLQNSSLSIAGNSVSLGGSLAADTLRASLGLSTAMHYRGKATVALSDGGTQDPTITGYDFTNDKMAGDVVIDKDSSMEYVWSGTAWERLGSETSFKTIQAAKSSPSASGTTTSFIDTISQDTNGVITATKKTVTTATTSTAGITTLNATTANTLLNQLTTGSSTPVDADYYISQYVGGGTTTTTYHRRPMSALWTYIKGKINATTDAFSISISGTAATATTANKLGTNAGSATQPIYFANGIPVAITGNIENGTTGNAATATKFASAQSITLTGDVTGTASSQAGWSIVTTLANSGVTASSYGPAVNVSPTHGGTFTVPYFTVDAKGRITAASSKTITLPTDNNTDTLVTQTNTTGDASYRLLLSENANDTTETKTARKSTKLQFNPSSGRLTLGSGAHINQAAIGTYTANVDNGSSSQTRYVPVKWTFNLGFEPVTGDTIVIKTPGVGHDWGTYISTDNGANYHPIAVYVGGSRLTTHYGTGSYIHLVYDANLITKDVFAIGGSNSRQNVTGSWYVLNFYDSNSDWGYYSRRIYTSVKAGSNKIFPYTLILKNADGRYESNVTSSTTATSKAKNTHGFLLEPLLWMYANATYNENVVVGTYNLYHYHSGLIDGRYSFNVTTSSGFTANRPIYLVGTINATDGLFYLDDNQWTQTLPTTEDGKVYIYLGDAYDAYRLVFINPNPVYYYSKGGLRTYSGYAEKSGTANKAIAANIATNTNGVAYYTNTSGTFGNIRSASGAFYSTGQDVAPKFGTLPIAQGGTNATSISAYAVVYGNSSGNGYTGLGANTTTTKKFLRMTGTGSAGTAPVWDTVTKSDVGLGNVENTKLSTWTGNTSISSIGTLTTGSIPWSLLTGIPSSFTPGTHSHGNITNDGKTSTAITLANNDFIIVGDSSDNGRIGKGPVFDASTETTALTQKGTWVTYAGGTAVTLNGTSKAKSTASFYAPTASGTANQVLISGGVNTAPSWTNQSNLSVGSATNATTAVTANKLGTNAGSKYQPVYFTGGIPTVGSGYTIEYIIGTQTASTNAWTGATNDTALYDGKMIMYVLPYAGTGTAATLNLTLADGTTTTGAKGIFRYGGTTGITTHYAAGSRILLIYDATNERWNSSAWYDSNTNTLLRVYSSATNISVPLIGQSSANSTTAAWSTYTGTYKDWYGAIPNNDAKRAKINLSTGAMTVPGGITANVVGTLTGNASSATKLQTTRSINGTNFDGTSDITTANWGTARNISISDSNGTHTGTAVSVNGSGNITLKLPATIKATLDGNAATATSASSAATATLAASAQKFDTNRTIALTGDTTGSASSNGASGWSITTTTKKLSQTTATALSSFTDTNALIYTAAGGSNTVTDKPTSVDAFGALSFKTADGWYGQLLMSSNNATGIYWRTATSLSGGWKKILDSTNYTDYTVTKTGSGASGSWGISITGNAATATTASKLGTTSAGSATKPIYWANGIPAEANTYAGGTAVTLNGTSKAKSTASFYAPESAGTSGQYLKSNGSGAPTWATFPTSMTPTSHTHGNITNAGTMNPSQITIANNDFIVVGDYSDSTGKITKGPIFDGSTTTSVLSQKGTWVAASPSVSITAGTSSAAPKVNITVLGASGTAQTITTASTSVYGVTKLSSTASSTEEGLAATPKGVQAAINALDVSDAAVNGQYVKQVTQTDGKITVTRADFAPSISITAGTASAAPKVNVTVNTKTGTAQSITKATTGVFGVTKLSSTSSTSEEGLAATPKGVWAAIDTVKYKVTQTADANNFEYPILTKSTVGVGTVTETVKFNSSTGKQTTINPSTGTISANSYKVADKVQLQYDATTESLNFVFI